MLSVLNEHPESVGIFVQSQSFISSVASFLKFRWFTASDGMRVSAKVRLSALNSEQDWGSWSDASGRRLRLTLDLRHCICLSIRERLRTGAQADRWYLHEHQGLAAAYNELEAQKNRGDETSLQKKVCLANMSYKNRTPMNGILDILDIFAVREIANKQGLPIDEIRTCSFQLMRFLDDPLALTKSEKGEVE
jgi:hypothetical protein